MTAVDVLTVVAAVTSGAMAGVFFTFSTFVMRGLADLPAPAGIAAMQSINLAVVRSVFLLLFLGAGGVGVAVVVVALAAGTGSTGLLIAGAVLYLLGSLGLTAARNQPMNLALGAADPTGPGAEAMWRRWVVVWIGWNHLRTATCTAAAALFSVALAV